MAAEKRPTSLPSDDPPAAAAKSSSSSSIGPPLPPPPAVENGEQQQDRLRQSDGDPPPQAVVNPAALEQDGSDGGADSQLSPNDDYDQDEYIKVNITEIHKSVECPICLGILRKTRTIMECLHRFCKECIDKSMRLGNNECPVCRTHRASRHSLRNDPKFDSLISLLYPDIDKYEEEELAFNEKEKKRNRKIQASIAETVRRQTEALGKRKSSAKAIAASFARKSQGSSSRDTAVMGSGDDKEDENGNDAAKDSSSMEERPPEVRQKRGRRSGQRSSPANK